MNILIICRDGEVKSKCLADMLDKRGYDTRYKGAMVCSNQVCIDDIEWADRVLILEDWIVNLFDDLNKVIMVSSIPNTFFDPEQKELREICRNAIHYLARFDI